MKKLVPFLAILCSLFFIFGCSGNKQEGTASQEGAAAQGTTAAPAAERDLVVAVGVESTHYITFEKSTQSGDLDHIVLYNVYDTLFYKDTTDGSIKPWVGTEWEMSPDGKTIKVKLRDDVYFHDGSKMTAADVKFTLDNARATQIGNGLLINYQTTEVVDDYNIIIHMEYPYNAIFNALCSRTACIMSKAYYEKVGEEGYMKNPIGTGAYKWVSWTSGDSIVLERNDEWWGGDSKFRKVTIKTIGDINTQVLALESGDVDVVVNAPVENLRYLSNPDVEWASCASNATEFTQFNMQDTNALMQDKNFRKAVQYAIDKDAINTAVFADQAVIVDIYGVPGFTGRPQAGTYSTYEYNIEKAKEYLAASSYNGQVFNIVCTAGSAIQKSAEVIQGSLYEAGINAKVTATDAATFFDTVRNTGDYDMNLVINTSSVLDQDSLFLTWAIERYQFKNIKMERGQEMNDLIIAARREPNNDKRLELYAQVCSILNEDAYGIFILGDVNTMAWRKGITGTQPNLAKYYRFSEWGF